MARGAMVGLRCDGELLETVYVASRESGCTMEDYLRAAVEEKVERDSASARVATVNSNGVILVPADWLDEDER